MTSPGMITTDELAQLFADNSDANDTQNFRRMVNIESPDCTVYVPAGRVPHPGADGELVSPPVVPPVPPLASPVAAGSIADGGIRICVPGYGNWDGLTQPLYANRVSIAIPYLLATPSGESPDCTV